MTPMLSQYVALIFVSILINTYAASTRTDECSPPMFGGRIRHVIAIMLENRSFDHMLGYQHAARSNINGCTPSVGLNCSNPFDPTDDESPLVYVDDKAVYIQPQDPDHSVSGTSLQTYNKYGDNAENYYPAPMKGFVQSYAKKEQKHREDMHDDGAFIMQCFNPSTLPILNTLAEEFGLIDHWFSSVPGSTDPNRVFSMMATSQGMATNYHPKLEEGFTGANIFKMIDEFAPDDLPNTPPQKWRTYFHDGPTSGFLNYVRTHAEHARPFESLLHDIKNGTLPIFSWVDPAYWDRGELHPASDQHPDHDVTQGEKLLKRIYEALRTSDRWWDTLLFVFYDEHGGFFDHVPPPKCPNPDGRNSTHITPPFSFNRLGLRVPAILVSPWIKKGTVAKVPAADEAQYCHSSLIKTMREQFAPTSPAFTKRDSWALAFDDLINLEEARVDCALRLPSIPVSSYDTVDYKPGDQPNNDYQISIAISTAAMCDRRDEVELFSDTQYNLGTFVKQCAEEWLLKASN